MRMDFLLKKLDSFLNKKGNKFYSSEMESFKKINRKIWDLDADIFIPGAGL